MLRTLAAQKKRRERRPPCRRAARETAIRGCRSMDQGTKLQVADEAALRLSQLNDCFIVRLQTNSQLGRGCEQGFVRVYCSCPKHCGYARKGAALGLFWKSCQRWRRFLHAPRSFAGQRSLTGGMSNDYCMLRACAQHVGGMHFGL